VVGREHEGLGLAAADPIEESPPFLLVKVLFPKKRKFIGGPGRIRTGDPRRVRAMSFGLLGLTS